MSEGKNSRTVEELQKLIKERLAEAKAAGTYARDYLDGITEEEITSLRLDDPNTAGLTNEEFVASISCNFQMVGITECLDGETIPQDEPSPTATGTAVGATPAVGSPRQGRE